MSNGASTDTLFMHVYPSRIRMPMSGRFLVALLAVLMCATDAAPQTRLSDWTEMRPITRIQYSFAAPLEGRMEVHGARSAPKQTLLTSHGLTREIKGQVRDWFKKMPSMGITEAEAGQGVKEALMQGVARAVLSLHKTDGFFGSEFYKVLLPPDSRKAEATLRRLGLGSQVDKAVLAINRGAEDAVGTAGPIFSGAIKEMTVTDALGIIRGSKDAATQYFRQKTSDHLIAAFSPSVKASLDRTHATKYYADIATSYNRLPLAFEKVDPDLTSYVVGRAVDALFDQIAREEANIRANPLARTTDLLKKVFGRT